MTESAPAAGSGAEATFRKFDAKQAASYSAMRGTYPGEVYKYIMSHHVATGGQTELVVDVGCGPGNSTRDLAPFFDDAFGVDPSEGMIEAATGLEGKAGSGRKIGYVVGAAEVLDGLEVLKGGGVDMITAATAAHWFDMPRFWESASKVLKPGGTVAFWIHAKVWIHPSVPNYEKAQEVMERFDSEHFAPYMLPGNILARNFYEGLVLPWSPECSPAVHAAFPEAEYHQKIWHQDGKLAEGEDYLGSREATLAQLAAIAATASPVVRWREENPDLVGTERDPVVMRNEALREALGVEKGEEATHKFRAGLSYLVTLVKRRAE